MRSVFGHIEKRARNVYRIRWTDASGKRRSKTVHGTRAVAQKELDAIDLGAHGATRSMTYAEYYDGMVRPTFSNLKPKTVAEYERLWSAELSGRIGGMDVGSATWRDVQSVIDMIGATSVQRKAFRLWRKIGNMAVRDGLASSNPCDGSIRFREHVKRDKGMIESADVKAFLGRIEGTKYEPVILCLIGGGLRLSEAVGLKWEDVEEWNGYAVLSIHRSVVTVGGVAVVQESTKTEKSRRECVIGQPFAARLLSLRSDGYIVGGDAPTNPATMSHNWKKWCERRGMDYVRLSDMRSVYATLCGEGGCPDSLVSMAMGHSDGTTKGANYQMATRRGLALVADMYADLICRES